MERLKKKKLIDLKTDVKLLLECLEYQKDDVNAVKQALVTLSTILHDSVEAKEEFQEAGGLEQVLQLITATKQNDILETGLYCLGSAVEKSVYSQKLLTNASIFTFLHEILSGSGEKFFRKKQTASYVILSLVMNNGFGQNLVRQSGCLHDILNLIRSAFLQNGRMDLNFFDSEEDSMYDLWTSLLSAVCACVNNPLNEDNQQICATMLPYLFSVLTRQSENQIIRPVLSFIGHTVASNSCNQDRVRKCGGIEILVSKLKLLQKHIDIGREVKGTAVQLLFTLDACLSDNELCSKRFGELNGISLIIKMLSKSCLEVADRVQTVLTLAHAVDAYAGNEKFVKLGNGITTLIQQLANSEDDEFNKIVKYLLQICVSKEDNNETTKDEPLPHIDAIKRLGDMQMLEKINNLDHKLKCLQTKNTRLGNTLFKGAGNDIVTQSYPSFRNESLFMLDGQIDDVHSVCSSRLSTRTKDSIVSARERNLLQQLRKEKSEKEKLEKLNQGLQETLIRNRSERFQQTKDTTSECCSSSVGSNSHKAHYGCAKNTNFNYYDSNNSSVRTNYEFGKPTYISTESHQNESSHCDINNTDTKSSKDCSENIGNFDRRWQNCSDNSIEISGNRHQNYMRQSNNDSTRKNRSCLHVSEDKLNSNSRNVAVGSCPEQPLDLTKSCSSNKITNKTINEGRSVSSSTTVTKKSEVLLPKSQKINRNAEIQCGTPFVLVSEQQSEIDCLTDGGNCRKDCSAQTDFIDRPTFRTASISDKEEDSSIVEETSEAISQYNVIHSSKSPTLGSIRGKSISKPRIVSESLQKPFLNSSKLGSIKGFVISKSNKQISSPNLNTSKTSDNFFVKPIARAPKMRVVSKQNALSGEKTHCPINVQQHSFVKSQNNVRHLDKYMEQPRGNAADKWQVHPNTPDKQKILPARPAFSDCGTRRYSFTTSSAMKSPKCIRKRSVDDSGIHSPNGELNLMSWGSPIDSDIDGFRSNSDESDVEVTKPSIHLGVLRSNKKKATQNKNNACPGCAAPYVGGLELNSRTYNIILETDPKTCQRHREMRECERKYIQEVKKAKKNKVKRRLIELKQPHRSIKPSKKTTPYDYASDSEKEISPIADENVKMNMRPYNLRQKPRRQRVPFTSQEEANLLKGVKSIGKHWNQILVTYDFHPSRTNVDLMWKYKRMQNAVNNSVASSYKSAQTRKRKPFSMCEERRLRRGIKKFGYSWKTILNHFTFSEGRTTKDLRNHWRCVHEKR